MLKLKQFKAGWVNDGDSLTLTSNYATGTITLDSSIDVSVATSVTLNAKTVSLTQTGSFTGISITLGNKVMTLALTTAAETQALASWMFPTNITSVSVTSTHATGEITLDKALTLARHSDADIKCGDIGSR